MKSGVNIKHQPRNVVLPSAVNSAEKIMTPHSRRRALRIWRASAPEKYAVGPSVLKMFNFNGEMILMLLI